MDPSLGQFGRLPGELRAGVYFHIFAGQLIHCCSSKKSGVYHLVGQPTVVDAESQRHAFDQECIACCESDYISFCRPVRWEQASCSVYTSIRPRDLLNFFLTCKTFWLEAEPLFWETAEFCIGLPQFKAFYDRFLKSPLKHHPRNEPRACLIQSLRLIIPDIRQLGNKMGYDYNFNHLSPYLCVLDAWEASARRLGSNMPALRHVHAVVSSSLITPDGDDPTIPFYMTTMAADVLNALFHLKGKLESFEIDFVGVVGTLGIPSLKALDPRDRLRQRLVAKSRALRDMLTKDTPPPIPEGVIAKDEPDKDMVELGWRALQYFEESTRSQ